MGQGGNIFKKKANHQNQIWLSLTLVDWPDLGSGLGLLCRGAALCRRLYNPFAGRFLGCVSLEDSLGK